MNERLMINLSAWVADAIAPAGIHFLCIAMNQASFKITKASYLLCFCSASVLFLESRCFELRSIYKQIPSSIRIPIFSSELASSFIDSGAGLVQSICFVSGLVDLRLLTTTNFKNKQDLID